MLGSIGIWEILIIFVIIALLFGGKKLPELGKGLGEGIRNFKRSISKDNDKKEKNKNDINNETVN